MRFFFALNTHIYLSIFIVNFLQDDRLTGQAILDVVFARLNLIETAYFGLRFLDEENQTVSTKIIVKSQFWRNFKFLIIVSIVLRSSSMNISKLDGFEQQLFKWCIWNYSFGFIQIELALVGPHVTNITAIERFERCLWSVFWCEILCGRSNKTHWRDNAVSVGGFCFRSFFCFVLTCALI